MKMSTILLCFTLMCFASSVSFAGVHSPPTNTESKTAKAIVNFEMQIVIAEAVAIKETLLTPVGENSPAVYAESIAKEVKAPIAVEEVLIGDHKRNSVSRLKGYKRSTDYTLTGYSIAFWRYC